MKEIIEISKQTIGAVETNAVNAREIHKYLGVKTRFADWIQRAIKKYDFLENVDYVCFLKNEKAGNNAVSKEYIVTIDMAKELAMLENNAKGKATRKYFIQIEKQYQAELTSPNEMYMQFMQNQQAHNEMVLKLLSAMQEQILKQEQKQIANALTPAQLDEIKRAVLKATKPLQDVHNLTWGEAIREVYAELNGRMGVFTYYQIAPSDFDEAIALLGRMKKQKEEQLETGEYKTLLSVNMEQAQ